MHRCPRNCTESMQSDEEALKDFRRVADLRTELTELKVLYSCEWSKIKKTDSYKNRFPAKLSIFLGDSKITTNKILDAVRNDLFFGIMMVNIETPVEIVKKYERMNFPFIFRKTEITESMVSKKNLKLANENKREFPHSCVTLTHNATNFIVTTPLLQFYLKIGLVVTEIHWAIQYIPTKPFEKFVQELVEVRIASVNTNASLGDRAKFTLNSCVGRFGHVVLHKINYSRNFHNN